MSANSQQSTTQSNNSTTSPWSVQSPYLSQAFSDASGSLSQAEKAQIPANFTAQYSPNQVSAFNQMLNYGTGNMNVPASSAAAGSTISAAGANGAANGLFGLANFTPQGGTQSNINSALQYAGNVPISAMTQAAMQGANDEAQYVTQPQINAAAAASGNVNSSRTAIQQGLVDRGLTQDASNIAANLTGNAYNSGLSLAEQNSEAANANRLQALTGQSIYGAFDTNAGTNANTGAVNQAGGLFNIANNGITGGYNAAQAPLTNQSQQFAANTNDPFAALTNFYNIVGNHNWGSQTTGTGTSTTNYDPSTMSQIGGWTNFLGGLF